MTDLHIENKAQAGVATIAVEPRDRDPFGIVETGCLPARKSPSPYLARLEDAASFGEPPARMEILA